MYLAGHVGFTLGFFALLSGKRGPLSAGQIASVSAVSLVPDAFDHALHWVSRSYPLHGIFHSLPFYAILILIIFLIYKKATIFPAVIAFSAALDLLNVNLGSLLYPLYNEASTAHVPVVRARIEAFMGLFPHTLGYRLSVGHYLVFEVIGLLIIVVTILRTAGKGGESVSSGPTSEGNRLKTLFTSLLSPMGGSACPVPDARYLPALKDLALKSEVLPLLYVQLSNCHAHKTDHVRQFLKDVEPYFLKSAVFSMKQEALEKEVQSLFRKEGVPVMVIKGNAIARDIYKDRNCRLSEDIDILVQKSDVFKAAALLMDAGYVSEPGVPLEYRFFSIHHATFYKAQDSIPLEMHWLFGVPAFFHLTSEEIWDEVISDGEGNYALSPELQIVLLLIHHHSHSFRELKILIDILWTCWRYEAGIDWHLFALRLEKVGLIKTAQITLAQIRSLWHDIPAGIAALETLAGEIEKRGHRVPKRFIAYFSMDITGDRRYSPSLDKIIKRFVLDRPSTIIRSFSVLLPSSRAIGARYGDRSLWRLPYNYSRFITWQLKCWKG